MLLDPFDSSKAVRYPDATLRGTCLAHFFNRSAFTSSPDMQTYGAAACLAHDLAQPTSTGTQYARDSIVPFDPANNQWMCYQASTGGFTPMADLKPTGSALGWRAGNLPGTLGQYYGPRQTTYEEASSQERTVAAALRLRTLGLPPGQFAYNGRVYFMWVPAADLPQTNATSATSGWYVSSAAEVALGAAASAITEARCMAMVEAGQGFTATLAEIDRVGGMSIPSLPVGPNSFMYRATGTSRVSGAWSSAYACDATGLPPGPGQFFTDVNADTPFEPGQFLVIAMFGVADGTELALEQAHVIEYIPSPSGSAIATPAVQFAPTAVRDEIMAATARVAASIGGESSVDALGWVSGVGARVGKTLTDFTASGLSRVAVGLATHGLAGLLPRGGAGGPVRPALL